MFVYVYIICNRAQNNRNKMFLQTRLRDLLNLLITDCFLESSGKPLEGLNFEKGEFFQSGFFFLTTVLRYN